MSEKMTGYPSIDKPWMKYYDNDTITDLPQNSLFEYAYQVNENRLDDIAFRFYGRKITYRVFFENAKKIGQSFINSGVKKGDIITILSMHIPEAIYIIYGLNYIGATANILYPTLSEKEIIDNLNKTNSKMFFVMDLFIEKIRNISSQINSEIVVIPLSESMPFALRCIVGLKQKSKHSFCKWSDFINKVNNGVECISETNKDDIAVIVYTSGTTGEPKGVMLSNYNLNSLICQYKAAGFLFKPGETFFNMIPTFLGYGVGMITIAIGNGLDIMLWIELEPQKVAKAIKNTKPNHVELGVAFIDAVLKEEYGNMPQLVTFAGGGGGVSIEKEREINSFLQKNSSPAKFIMGYGMTEFSSSICTNLPQIQKEGSIGVPLPYAIAKIVDNETGEELPVGETGEICFNAPNVMVGYYGNEAETINIIKNDENGIPWLHTGDLCHIDEDGFIFFDGRIKRVAYTRQSDGTVMRVFPQHIEEFIETQDGVKKCAVIMKDDEKRISIAHAYIEVIDDVKNGEELIKYLKEAIKGGLSEHHWPEQITIIKSIPITPSGKINYREIEKYD